MFVEAAIAVFCLGLLAGGATVFVWYAAPLERENDALRRAAVRRALRDTVEELDRQRYRASLLRDMGVADGHTGSRRALKAVK